MYLTVGDDVMGGGPGCEAVRLEAEEDWDALDKRTLKSSATRLFFELFMLVAAASATAGASSAAARAVAEQLVSGCASARSAGSRAVLRHIFAGIAPQALRHYAAHPSCA